MTEQTFAGLTNLQKELLESLKGEGRQERKKLALELLDWIDAASVLGFKFDGDDYFPEGDRIDQNIVRDIKIAVRAQSRWWNDPNRPKSTYEFIPPKSSSISSNVPNVQSETPNFEDVF